MDKYATPVKIIVALFFAFALVMFGYVAGFSKSDREWQAKWSARDAADAKAAQAFTEQQRRIELQRQGTIDGIQAQAEKDIATAQRNAAIAAAESDRLQRGIEQAIAKLRGGDDTGATTISKTGASTSSLLAVLFREIDTAAGEYAAEADRARAAGLTCERAYDAVRGNK